MPTTRSTTAYAPKNSSSDTISAGTKRSAESSTSSAPKRAKSTKKGAKKQMTIDETLNGRNAGNGGDEDVKQETNGKGEEQRDDTSTAAEAKEEDAEEGSSKEEQKSSSEKQEDTSKEETSKTSSAKGKNHPTTSSSSSSTSTILEKGLIYFFFKPRVNTTSPTSLADVARTYIILRPLPLSSPLTESTLQQADMVRMLALPKKTLPRNGRDRFLAFVEMGRVGVEEVREKLRGSEYETKTKGTSHQPSSRPFASGIYTLLTTNTGRTSHLAYHITSPSSSSPSEIQTELGLAEKGSFVVSVKNPEAPTPPSTNASYLKPAQYEKELQEKFEGRRWGVCGSEYLDVVGTQMLMIGEGRGEFGKAVEGESGVDGEGGGKEGVEEEIERLEDEDQDRVEGLKEDDPVFADLGLSSKEFEKLQTTW